MLRHYGQRDLKAAVGGGLGGSEYLRGRISVADLHRDGFGENLITAGSATEAEILAKAAFLGAEVDVPRVLVTADGRTILAGGLA